MRRGILPFGSQIVLLLLAAAAQAAEPLFESDGLLVVDIEGPLRETLRDDENRVPRPFVLGVDGRELDIDVRVRGHSRAEACHFPPLRLDFGRAATHRTPFAGQGSIKLVTHCKGGDSYNRNVLEEYLAYRIFALLSENAFRVRLMQVRYLDSARLEREALPRHAFAIEPGRVLAERAGGRLARTGLVHTANLDRAQTALVFVFQFLIGNTDWSLVRGDRDAHCCHNVELLDVGGRLVPVPYDFDQAGIVNAAYAKPHPGLGIRKVTSRRYRGYCIADLDLEAAVRQAVSAEPGIRALVTELPGASEQETRRRLAYLDEFFAEAREPGALAAEFERRCVD